MVPTVRLWKRNLATEPPGPRVPVLTEPQCSLHSQFKTSALVSRTQPGTEKPSGHTANSGSRVCVALYF